MKEERLGELLSFRGRETRVPRVEAALPDLSIGIERQGELIIGRLVASVDVELPRHTPIHRGTREYVKRHLVGRNPVVFEEHGYLRVAFALENRDDATLARVEEFATQMGVIFKTAAVDWRAFQLPA